MRISGSRALLAVACAALAVAAAVYPAGALFLNLLPDNPFIGSRVQSDQPVDSTSHNFFSTALGMIPVGNQSSSQQINIVPNLKGNIDKSNFGLPSSTTGDNWMNNAFSSGVSLNMSTNPAMNSYSSLINRFPNQSNIFGPYTFGS